MCAISGKFGLLSHQGKHRFNCAALPNYPTLQPVAPPPPEPDKIIK